MSVLVGNAMGNNIPWEILANYSSECTGELNEAAMDTTEK